MKFSLKSALGFMLVVAIALAIVRSTSWRLTAKRDISCRMRLGDRSQGYPVINAIGFYKVGVKVVVLHRVTSENFDVGDNQPYSAFYPTWLDIRGTGIGRVFDCVVDGRRVDIEDDSVQIFYATDGEKPKYVRLKNSNYASSTREGFLVSNEHMWRLAEQHSKDAEPSVTK